MHWLNAAWLKNTYCIVFDDLYMYLFIRKIVYQKMNLKTPKTLRKWSEIFQLQISELQFLITPIVSRGL